MDFTDKFWKKAIKLIPGGTHLFSKRPENFSKKNWPKYFRKAKGCFIWDFDNKKYLDMGFMGVGTNILGYANKIIDDQVIRTIKSANMSSINSIEDVLLAEKLIDMHKGLHMARFTRSGGEANAVAIRIARCATDKKNIAICGYHGWHDWYLANNFNKSKPLDSLLMKNLSTEGVHPNLKGTVFGFKYNDYKGLEKLISNNKEIGIIKMEVIRNLKPKDDFLQKVRDLANKKNIILIFDECTTGFRETFGGIYKKFRVEPDMLILGKALGNGYAINAVLGKKEIMECANNTFISSTFWTERIGPTAALKTLEVMDNLKSWKLITHQGLEVQKKWKNLAKNYKLEINVSGIPALSSFEIVSKDWNKYKPFIIKKMLQKNILSSNSIYFCINHEEKNINRYFNELNDIFSDIQKFEQKSKSIDDYIKKSEISKSGFYRLN